MSKFLQNIAVELTKLSDYHLKTVVLPNKRAGIFLKKALVELEQKPIIAPRILTIQEFITGLSPYQPVDELMLWFEFYQVYKQVYGDKAQIFDEFIKWAPAILQDFNEIDRFLVDAREVFTYINEVKKIEDWQLKPESPKLITDYLKFYASLYELYKGLVKRLNKKNLAYQGMIDRYVAEHIEDEQSDFEPQSIIFAGFNALTRCEEKIIKSLTDNKISQVFWDADAYYMKPDFEAGKFLRKYQNIFKDFKWVENHFEKAKQIEIIGVPGNSTQTQVVADLLAEKNEAFEETAVVLNDENLLLPLINSLPDNISSFNISLGLPLGQLPVAQLFEQLLQIYIDYERYDKIAVDKLIEWLNHNYLTQILPKKIQLENESLSVQLQKYKTRFMQVEVWEQFANNSNSFIQNLIPVQINVKGILNRFMFLINYLSDKNLGNLDQLALVRLEKLVNYLNSFVTQTGAIENTGSLQQLFNRLLRQERLAFEGEPLQGLQIMGILETRLLDFKHVILTSMNEGIVPEGKNERSIIPFELKRHFGLPMHTEHTAVIAYHFYRLLQRAEKITLLYNTDPNGLGAAEQSRFITQLENELNNEVHHITKKQINLSVDIIPSELQVVEKDEFIIQRLKEIALSGFSASSLSAYMRNPLIFYKQKVLGLYPSEERLDAIPANTMGNIIHAIIEKLYKKYTGKILRSEDFEQILQQYETISLHEFITYTFGNDVPVNEDLIEGKNLIIFEIIKKNVKDILLLDKKNVQQGNRLEIVALEQRYQIKLPVSGCEVYIKGFVDRIDRFNGQLRVIDYKTGKVEMKNIQAVDLEQITQKKETEKLFQLLVYAWLYYKSEHLQTSDLPLQAGIISPRYIKHGVFTAEINGSSAIDSSMLKRFENQLIALVSEIINPEIPFVETDSPY